MKPERLGRNRGGLPTVVGVRDCRPDEVEADAGGDVPVLRSKQRLYGQDRRGGVADPCPRWGDQGAHSLAARIHPGSGGAPSVGVPSSREGLGKPKRAQRAEHLVPFRRRVDPVAGVAPRWAAAHKGRRKNPAWGIGVCLGVDAREVESPQGVKVGKDGDLVVTAKGLNCVVNGTRAGEQGAEALQGSRRIRVGADSRDVLAPVVEVDKHQGRGRRRDGEELPQEAFCFDGRVVVAPGLVVLAYREVASGVRPKQPGRKRGRGREAVSGQERREEVDRGEGAEGKGRGRDGERAEREREREASLPVCPTTLSLGPPMMLSSRRTRSAVSRPRAHLERQRLYASALPPGRA